MLARGVRRMFAVALREYRAALEDSFQRRLSNVAGTSASQISAVDIADARALGEEATGYANLEVQLLALRATTGLANASLFDSTRAVIFDTRGPEYQHEPTRLDTLAPGDVAQALCWILLEQSAQHTREWPRVLRQCLPVRLVPQHAC